MVFVKQKVDYSKIAQTYDDARKIRKARLAFWLGKLCELGKIGPGAKVLDLGCGTGRWAVPIAYDIGCHVTAADASPEMLACGKDKDTKNLVTWVQQDAQCLALQDNFFDVIFISHLLHHVDDPFAVVTESFRVLRLGGAILLRYGAIEQIRDDVELRFFPEIVSIDEKRTPSVADVESLLCKAGFDQIHSIEVVQNTFASARERLAAIKLKSISALTLISQEAFVKDLRRLEQHLRRNPNAPSFLIDKLSLTAAYKPQNQKI